MRRICSLSSGSSGNALLYSCGDTHILLDAGISCLRITRALRDLGLAAEDLNAVLITHSHTDHIGGLATLSKRCGVPVYASYGAACAMAYQIPEVIPHLHDFRAGEGFDLGECRVQSFSTSHDAPESVDYRIDGDGFSFGALTDTGFVTEGAEALLPGVDALLLEANHDTALLEHGAYPYYLKRRILGEQGHLSNETAAAFAGRAVSAGTKTVLLGHLSKENNTPDLARQAVEPSLGGRAALYVAPRSEMLTLTLGEEAALCRR